MGLYIFIYIYTYIVCIYMYICMHKCMVIHWVYKVLYGAIQEGHSPDTHLR